MRVADENGMKIRYVIDTHVHADHISTGRKLAEMAGAKYVLHASAGACSIERSFPRSTAVKVTRLETSDPPHTGHLLAMINPPSSPIPPLTSRDLVTP